MIYVDPTPLMTALVSTVLVECHIGHLSKEHQHDRSPACRQVPKNQKERIYEKENKSSEKTRYSRPNRGEMLVPIKNVLPMCK